MRVFEKLRLKLNKELGLEIPPDAEFKRTYAGYWQLKAGTWKWYCLWHTGIYREVGSCYTAKEILQASRLSISNDDNEICVED